jgi:hypothetical protein
MAANNTLFTLFLKEFLKNALKKGNGSENTNNQ